MNEINLKLSVFAPVYNEGETLPILVDQMGPFLDHFVGKNLWEFVFVDNGSVDDTKDIIMTVKEKYPFTQYVYLQVPNIGEALYTGMLKAKAPWGLLINVDWWDPLFTVWAWNSREDYDLFVASKRLDPSLDHRSEFRRFLSWGLNFCLKVLTGYRGSDTHGPKLICMDKIRPIIQKCSLRRGQFDTQFTLAAHRRGFRVAEFPIGVQEIRKRRNTMIKKIVQNVIDVCRLSIKVRKFKNEGPVKFNQFKREDALEFQRLIDEYEHEKLSLIVGR